MSVEVTVSRDADVGGQTVRRALPIRTRRTVGSWCFADHLGPVTVTENGGMSIGPHPHIGLQTVTWLVAGEVVHHDSLGSEQLVRPGQLNLMTAGGGVAHAEEPTGQYAGDFHGIQLWVAQPEATRHGPAAFEHHAVLPAVELDGATAIVIVGEVAGATSPARRDTDHMGAELTVRAGTTAVPIRSDYEYALIVLDGTVTIDGEALTPGHLGYAGMGNDELVLTATAPSRALLLGGVPFEGPIHMWWNFVGGSREEIGAARADWQADADRFGDVVSKLDRIPAPPLPWRSVT